MSIEQGTATFIAAMVALAGVVVSVFVSLLQSRRIARATIAAGLRARQVDAYVTVIRYVAGTGIAVQDHTFDGNRGNSFVLNSWSPS